MVLTHLRDPAVALVLGLLILISLLLHSRAGPRITRNRQLLRNPPNTLPIVGNGILFLQARQKLFAWFTKCIQTHGHETLRIAVPSLPPGVIIASPANLDFVFRNEGVFQKGDFFKARSWDLFGNGIINADGELWRGQRKAGLQFLSARNLGVLTDVALPRYLGDLRATLEGRAVDGQAVDLQGLVHELTTQLMGRMAYDMEMHADDEFTVAFEYASGATAERFQNPLWFITELLTGSRLRSSIRTIKAFGRTIVAKAVRERHGAQAAGDADGGMDSISGSLINSLLSSIGDEALVADSALNYLSAGRDTVAQALTWTFYLLMKHPSAVERLRDAVRQLQDEEPIRAVLANPANLTPTKLPYALAIFYESLRLYPPIPFEIKQAQADTTLPDGTFLPKSSVVVWCPWAMNRSTDTWGKDALNFRPERWLAGDGQVAGRTAGEFPVFNGGPRLCLGKRMAELMGVQVVASLVSLFDFSPAFEGERVSRSSLTLPMEGGLPVYVEKRDAI